MLEEKDLLAIEAEEGGSLPTRKRSPAAAAWDKEHLTTVTTKMRTEEVRRLQVVCLLEGVTPYHLLQSYLKAWLGMAERRQRPGDLARMRALCEALGWDFRRLRS